MFKPNSPLIKLLIIVFTLGLAIYLLMVFADHPQAVEQYYSQGLYQGVALVLHSLFNWLPFSIGDLVYIAVSLLLAYVVFNIIRHLFKKRFKQAVYSSLRLVIGIQIGVVVFYLFWGLNYFRPPASVRLGLTDTAYTLTDLKAVTLVLIDSANQTRQKLSAADMARPNDSIYNSAQQALKNLSDSSSQFKTFNPGVKPAMLTFVINYLGTSGYYNPFTGEAQINYQMPVYMRPFVACHELSHQVGFGPEDEANFAGFLAGIKSKDKLLRYSAYYTGMEEFMYALRAADTTSFKLFKKRISKNVMADLKAEREYWQYYEGKLDAISSIFYDKFLKVNNQPQGLLTYNQMINLAMAWYKKQLYTHR
ncbi:DUF3810 domain-containing protein [Mucilaginibacter sp. JRF]|uniref:DUF3810 domain-containing protein n=1 Tax=Mucilaginibacter sp. JRF TaxID=2780088 RepID=UPI0018825078|nr:DUF3810 domain-containing protein [Mucilaginibacter sp. JRF]MBE9585238.1 DUF3810 domain-containing protein [Mucilaginibacter sp. JRF]